MPDVEIEILGRTHQKIGFGNHKETDSQLSSEAAVIRRQPYDKF